MSDEFTRDYAFWRVVIEQKLTPTEVDSWDWDELTAANAYLDMQSDHKTAMDMYLKAQMNKPEPPK